MATFVKFVVLFGFACACIYLLPVHFPAVQHVAFRIASFNFSYGLCFLLVMLLLGYRMLKAK